jgi:hypothetical protein
MRPLFLLFFLSFLSNIPAAAAGEVEEYLRQYRQKQVGDYVREMEIISGYRLEQLLAELEAFYRDTLPPMRQKAYYLTYKKGVGMPSGQRTMAVTQLVKGLDDRDGGVIGLAIGYLQAFAPGDFDAGAQSVISAKLRYTGMPHYGDLALLAGYAGIGKEALSRLYIQPGLPMNRKWYVALALARMGHTEALEYCMKKIKSLPVNSEMISYALPDVIYMRQKEAMDYCVKLLGSDKNLCLSPNPDLPESILCAYRIMELLAPVIVDFPVQVDVSGTLDTDDYPRALQRVRAWFSKNSHYEINTATY